MSSKKFQTRDFLITQQSIGNQDSLPKLGKFQSSQKFSRQTSLSRRIVSGLNSPRKGELSSPVNRKKLDKKKVKKSKRKRTEKSVNEIFERLYTNTSQKEKRNKKKAGEAGVNKNLEIHYQCKNSISPLKKKNFP